MTVLFYYSWHHHRDSILSRSTPDCDRGRFPRAVKLLIFSVS
ncbi:MAG: hypothetical protein SAJ12_19160 [Jaaginema sp. PMC 1079.18]|nr:hypothetical protein [Jaaginema sp. PMC 1080.18]MEC4853106.1 hypothetical protein [Jaaginema sp. PMC 1079.18]